jgi:hypothetical protein
MPPLIGPSYIPVRNLEAEKACVQKRIMAFQKTIQHNKITSWMVNTIDEFIIEFLDGRTIKPYTTDEVYDRFQRTVQKRHFEDYMNDPSIELAKFELFLKQEAYGKPAPPRGIIKCSDAFLVEYSKYTYPMADYLKKNTMWYAFGLTPREIAERVAALCSRADSIVNSDFSKFDGHVSKIIRALEHRLLVKAFNATNKEIRELHGLQMNSKVRTSFFHRYTSPYARISGSPDTSVFNSIVNAFVAFATFRKMGLSPSDAYKSLGIYGGDDGMTPNIDAKTYISTSSTFNFDLKAETIQRGSYGVNFLARYYSKDVWLGCPDNICDFLRVMSKFHQRPKSNLITANESFLAKAFSLYLSDSETPFIKNFSRYRDYFDDPESKLSKILTMYQNYINKCPRDQQYSCSSENASNILDFLQDKMKFYVNEDLELVIEDLSKVIPICYLDESNECGWIDDFGYSH